MNYDTWKTTEPDPYAERRTPADRVICRDCGATIRSGGMTTGIASGASCQACAAVRRQHGWEFEPMTLRELRRLLGAA